MKKFTNKFIALLCVLLLGISLIFVAACTGDNNNTDGGDNKNKPDTTETIDYVSQLKLDMSSNTNKLEVTIKFLVDGDTTHFNVPSENTKDFVNGYIKARYLAVNTPESTGKIEKWGKTASNYVADKLSNASIIVESDDDKWNVDSTGERYLLWIWYKGPEDTDYRNLNIELLQEGYGRGSSPEGTRYGEIALAAILQAQDLKLKVWGNANDPNFYGGEAEEVDLRYLRFHIENYIQQPVRVEGIVTAKFANSAYIEEYDSETDTYYGIAVYYHYDTGKLLDILSVGHRVSVCGKVTEFSGTYQISDVSYNEARPWLTTNTFWLDEEEETVYTPEFRETSVADLTVTNARPVTYTFEEWDEESGEMKEVERTIQYGDAVMDTAVTLKNLTVTRMYTTKDANNQPTGQISVYCVDEDGNQITLRTEPLKKSDNKTLYTEADIGVGTVISSVKGIVDKYEGSFQIAIYEWACFTFAE